MSGVGQLGFSYIGAVFLLALFVPNTVWALTATSEDRDPGFENRVLRWLERAGQVLTTAAALGFTDTNLRAWTPWSGWLAAAAVLMVGYEAAWIRYFACGRKARDFYRTLAGVPLPLSTLPVGAFMLLGLYGRLWPLMAATIVLGIGHIGIHAQHYRQLARPRSHRLGRRWRVEHPDASSGARGGPGPDSSSPLSSSGRR